ncbi:MAG: DNA-processing protein DprA [Coriobacteriales bacterium]|nr:DNA-processing protein DprA [Coriobacteriales bacterium]
MYSGHPRCCIERDDGSYPQQLEELSSPPDRLYCIGDVELLNQASLSIVGARQATPYGMGLATIFGKRAAQMGLVVVSGGAVGCDQAAAKAALDGQGPTVVVLGGGADVVYPSKSGPLFRDILDRGGLLVSENPWGSPPLRPYFVERNRIIAALSRATLIVEAGLYSGTFSTADAALDCGREVLVVPGSIHSPQSQGSNRLLYQGAHPVCDIESFDQIIHDIYPLEVLELQRGKLLQADAGFNGDQKNLLSMLSANPMRFDEICFHLRKDPVQLNMLLVDMESRGLIVQGRDMRWSVPVRLAGR